MDLPSHLTTVLFDMGNTLSHLDHAWIAAAARGHGCDITAAAVARAEYVAKAAIDDEIRARVSGSDATRQRTYYETLLDAVGVPAQQVPAIVAEMRAEDLRSSLWRVVDRGTAAILAALRRRGFTLGVVSNADGRVTSALVAHGIAEHFAVVVDSHVVGVEKPDARIFSIALKGCAARPEHALFVGDIYEIDVQGARGAGIAPLLLDPLNAYATANCDRIDSLARLLELLPERASSVP